MEEALKYNPKAKVRTFKYRCTCGLFHTNRKEYLNKSVCPICCTEIREREK